MDKQLDACFDRVEKALTTLVDSISKYHPSVNQVHELGLADVELNKGLEDLQTHQSNYRRIQDLRAATASFDSQIKETLRLLANTRKELVGAPATVFPSDVPSYDINYDELLAYARRISKTTMPPAGSASADATQANSGAETGVATPADGITPNGAAPAAPPQQANGVTADPSSSQQPNNNPNASMTTITGAEANPTALPEDMQWELNPYRGFTFFPWPSEEQVRQGALVSLAFLAEQGIDAEDYDPEAEKQRKQREEEEAKAAQERERLEREERERRAREEQARLRAEREREQREAWRRASISGGAAGAGAAGTASSPVGGEKKQFQFMADDDEDDDE
ncbi:uncharacterized protein F4807DRAFT_148595 [Annulohypoxylon truncatum]|uniref:uncharacterized protein n=1 Tax=Annulohypoxylon truncatum TaxID=327061 RepID=UPI00200770DB|nr:uncharacterized protein F4807DRAFT_148595 [Annulohypoxylon truncatum]KAI1208344.1 hypothetical protein F4807DRAFT_148595 [Annulohypoxylon truncatum]